MHRGVDEVSKGRVARLEFRIRERNGVHDPVDNVEEGESEGKHLA